jgi:ribosomal protein S18 acetylase RimI-like enzyme
MALPDSPLRVTQRGTWPGPITFRRGWARANARRWNDVEPDAHLRLVRGGTPFLDACIRPLLECGAPSVISPPLPPAGRRTWHEAGFEDFLELALMRLSLDISPPPPSHLVVESTDQRIDEMLTIDAAAFSPFWRFDGLGLREALDATGRSTVLVIRDSDAGLAGYAIVGFGNAISYLQRVAVHPKWQGAGMGRSLIRVAARRARATGARVMLLNTQLDNAAALALYASEGYVRLPEPLNLLRLGAR